ncbi:MAG: acyl-CoA/acyl-ACP dehydrogenase [Myxococcales bacterium]|nr:acyl-CoA/acyl-ACP dehydrogenase [Myxococcales bacterium]
MHFAFTDEQEELRDSARAFLAEHSSGDQVRQAMASELGYDPEVWKRIGSELGWPCVIVPEAYGGIGLGAVELVALMEVMGESLLCSPFFSTVCLATQTILQSGDDAQKARYLPDIAEGQCRAALAYAEAGGGREPDEISTTATQDAGGYRLSGCKRFVVDGHSADLLVVAARAPGSSGEEGISLFVLPAEIEGLSRRALPTLDQSRRQAEITLEDVRVDADARLGEEGAAWPALQRSLDLAAIALAAEQAGGAQRCLDLSVDYAKERQQFGRPIGSFQAIKHKCADMMVRVESARSAAYYAGCVAAEPEAGDLERAASLAKSYCSEAYFHCAGESIQIHGGVGFTWEYDPHLHFKRAQWGKACLGEAAWHRERVARKLGL